MIGNQFLQEISKSNFELSSSPDRRPTTQIQLDPARNKLSAGNRTNIPQGTAADPRSDGSLPSPYPGTPL